MLNPKTIRQVNTIDQDSLLVVIDKNGNTLFKVRSEDMLKTVSALYKNGVVVTSSFNSGSYPNNPFTQFGRHSAGITSIFDCAEHIFYNRVLTTQELSDVQTYLTSKWAL